MSSEPTSEELARWFAPAFEKLKREASYTPPEKPCVGQFWQTPDGWLHVWRGDIWLTCHIPMPRPADPEEPEAEK